MNLAARVFPALVAAALATTARAQLPTRIDYALRIDTSTNGIAVEMTIRGAPADFRLAMVSHVEYDDEYWRYVSDLRGDSPRTMITREDSALWHVAAPAGEVTVHYRVRYPPAASTPQIWKAHLTPRGGLIGGPHSFIYMVGAERVPVRVTVDAPASWRIVTGLDTTTSARTFAASGIEQLTDSPMLVGELRRFAFAIDGVTHGVTWLGKPNGTTFDTARFVSDVERFSRATVQFFGRMPYRRYEFLFEDGAFGALEHINSVSMATPSERLAADATFSLPQLAHEFFHTWNEVRVRPASWIGVRHLPPEPNGELWWAEGVTLFYSDLLLRRAALPVTDSTRTRHLARLIEAWLANPSNARISAEATGRAFNKPLGTMGDYSPSFYTQGELFANLLDLTLRARNGGARSLDDAMRAMATEFDETHGYTGADVERAVEGSCGCELRAFFDDHVRGAKPLDLDALLAPAGLRALETWTPVLGDDGKPAPDLRIQVGTSAAAPGVLLNVLFPESPLGRAGYHTRDRVVSVNGVAIPDVPAFRRAVGALHIGDSLRVVVMRGEKRYERAVVITGYERPTVRIEVRADATPAQRKLLEAWSAAR